jgi:hypothetical protein
MLVLRSRMKIAFSGVKLEKMGLKELLKEDPGGARIGAGGTGNKQMDQLKGLEVSGEGDW